MTEVNSRWKVQDDKVCCVVVLWMLIGVLVALIVLETHSYVLAVRLGTVRDIFDRA